MKLIKILSLALTGALAGGVLAAPEPKTLLDSVQGDWCFFLQPEFVATRLGGESAQLAGLRFGPSLGRTLYLGWDTYALISDVDQDNGTSSEVKAFDFWHTGLSAEYVLFPGQVLHGSLKLLVGGGHLSVESQDAGSDSATVFVAAPQASIMVSLTKTIELGCGASYRFVNGSNLDRWESSDLSDFAGSVFLRWTEAP